MSNEMRERASRSHNKHEADIAPGAEAARERCTKRQQPREIKADMQEISVDECISEESPQFGAETARQRAGDLRAVARRDKGERQNETRVLIVGQRKHSQRVDKQENNHRRDHDRWHVEYWFFAFRHRQTT